MSAPFEAPAGLTDIQKCDLSSIWKLHSTHLLGGNNNTNIQQQQQQQQQQHRNGDDGIPVPAMDNQTFGFIASLTSFFIHVVSDFASESISKNDHTNNDSNEHDNEHVQAKHQKVNFDSTFEIIQCFFPRLGFGPIDDNVLRSNPDNNNNNNNNNIQQLKSFLMTPRVSNGRHIITIDHASLLNELQSCNKKNLNEFGAFLYHKPQVGICAFNCAIALTLVTLTKRHDLKNSSSPTKTTSNIPSFTIQSRFYNVYPTIQIQHVKTSNAYKFISLKGRIIKVHSKRLRLLTADVLCIKCGNVFEHLFHDGRYELPTRCRANPNNNESSSSSNNNNNINSNSNSKPQSCRGQKFELIRRTAKYIDYQKLKLQEDDNQSSMASSTAAAGRTPRSIDLEVTHDLVDKCHAGDCVKVVGIIHAMNNAVASGKANKKSVNETSTYTLYMVANSIVNTASDLHFSNKRGAKDSNATSTTRGGFMFTQDQLEKITKVAHADHMYGPLSARMAFPFDLLVRSLCPSIIGHDMVKAGILLGLLGGTPPSSTYGLEDVKSGLTIRSNIHVLIVGDPGMGKSCLLLASQQVASRSVYVGGNTSSTTGLTVSLSKEAGGEVGIEAGALVLADQGVCCIDEFDKMAKSNQDGLLEAMEQQRISIAKAGVIASLPARCCVIAAANPRHGKYNMNKTVAENLNIAPPLLSRFDLVFILRDDADLDQDQLISGNIMDLYRRESNDARKNRQNEGPNKRQKKANDNTDASLNSFDIKRRLPWVAQTQKPLPADLLKDYITYAREYCKPKLTQDAATVLKNYFMTLRYPENGTCRNDSVPITTRQLEALIRLSQARAKACLRDFVLKEDAEDVVELMRDSVDQIHRDSSGNLDPTRGGVVGKSKRKKKKIFMDALRQTNQIQFSKDDFYRVSAKLELPLNDFWTLVDELRFSDQPELRKGQDGCYYIL